MSRDCLVRLSIIDLVSLEEQEARTALLAGVRRERAKPSSVSFPQEARIPITPPAFPKTLPSVWTVPYWHNPYFTGREDELASLANRLSTGGTLALTQSLSGLGGIGVTAQVSRGLPNVGKPGKVRI